MQSQGHAEMMGEGLHPLNFRQALTCVNYLVLKATQSDGRPPYLHLAEEVK